jgi:hypothetical protein
MNDYKRVLLVVLGAILLLPVGFGIRQAINDGGEKNARMYNTAIQATEQDRFNYAIDSHQGKVLTYGQFTPTRLVKFPEMSKEFAYVEKTKEKYNRHEREVCETKYRTETHTETVPDGEGGYTTETVTEEVPYEECHQEEYYSWDFESSEEQSTPAWRLFNREYPTALFATGQFEHHADACEFTTKNTANWLQAKNGCDGGDFYTDNTTRYSYRVIGAGGFAAGFLADASNGKLEGVGGGRVDLRQQSVEDMVKQANDYKTPGNIFIVFWWIVIIGAMGVLAYQWALNDGVWQ